MWGGGGINDCKCGLAYGYWVALFFEKKRNVQLREGKDEFLYKVLYWGQKHILLKKFKMTAQKS